MFQTYRSLDALVGDIREKCLGDPLSVLLLLLLHRAAGLLSHQIDGTLVHRSQAGGARGRRLDLRKRPARGAMLLLIGGWCRLGRGHRFEQQCPLLQGLLLRWRWVRG